MHQPKRTSKDTQIKKGEVRNPNGGRAHNPTLKKIKKASVHELVEIAETLLDGNLASIKKILEDSTKNPDSKHSVLKAWIASVVFTAVSKGDVSALNSILDRVIGKVSDKIDHTTNGQSMNGPFTIQFVDPPGKK